MRNEGKIERVIQITISIVLFLGSFFWVSGFLELMFFIMAVAIGIFAIIGFCPFYVIIGKNTANKK